MHSFGSLVSFVEHGEKKPFELLVIVHAIAVADRRLGESPVELKLVVEVDRRTKRVNRPEFPGDFFAWIPQATLA